MILEVVLTKEKRLFDLLGSSMGAGISDLADEKSISRDSISQALLSALELSLCEESNIDVKIKVDDEGMHVYAVLSRECMYNSFRNLSPDCHVSDVSEEHLEYLCSYSLNNDLSMFSRALIRKISDHFRSEVKKLEKQHELSVFENKRGEIVSGTVIAFEFGHCIVSLGHGEGFLSKREMLPNDFFDIGSQIKTYVQDVKFNLEGYQIILSRSSPEFLIGIMTGLIPELQNRSMTILKAVREPGMRSKVAVYSESKSVNPVFCCIGREGMLIKLIRSEIGNEGVDIVLWDEDDAVFIANSLYPLQAKKIIFDDNNCVEVVVSDEDFNKAKSHRHQQVRLASKLTGYVIRLVSASEDVQRNAIERQEALSDFMTLNLNEFEIRMLLDNDIRTLEDFVQVPFDEILDILSDSRSSEQLHNMISKAKDCINEKIQNLYLNNNVDFILFNMPYANQIPLSTLCGSKIYGVEDLLQFSAIDLSNVIGDYLEGDLIGQCQEILDWAVKQQRGK